MTVAALIVEDNALVAEMVRGILEEIGHTVAGKALDGQQAVEMTVSLRPDVVLMDLGLPDINGIEATRRIFQRCPTPVVVLSALETPELVEEASAAGVGAYLVKPPNPKEMERAIMVAMARFDDIVELRHLNVELQERNQELQNALSEVKMLSGLLPICASCKDIRDDKGYWHRVEVYIRQHSEAEFSHGLCPECVKKLYPDLYEKWKKSGRI